MPSDARKLRQPVSEHPGGVLVLYYEKEGETHDLSVAVAEQLSRDLDAAIETLQGARNEDSHVVDEDADPVREFVDVLTTVEDVGPIVAERLARRRCRHNSRQ